MKPSTDIVIKQDIDDDEWIGTIEPISVAPIISGELVSHDSTDEQSQDSVSGDIIPYPKSPAGLEIRVPTPGRKRTSSTPFQTGHPKTDIVSRLPKFKYNLSYKCVDAKLRLTVSSSGRLAKIWGVVCSCKGK